MNLKSFRAKLGPNTLDPDEPDPPKVAVEGPAVYVDARAGSIYRGINYDEQSALNKDAAMTMAGLRLEVDKLRSAMAASNVRATGAIVHPSVSVELEAEIGLLYGQAKRKPSVPMTDFVEVHVTYAERATAQLRDQQAIIRYAGDKARARLGMVNLIFDHMTQPSDPLAPHFVVTFRRP